MQTPEISQSASVESEASPLTRFAKGTWVADFANPARPRLALVKEPNEWKGEVNLDLYMYSKEGERLGRVSPAMGGPTKFEPCCPAASWVPIAEPDFEFISSKFFYGRYLKCLHTENPNGPMPFGPD